MPGCAQQGSRSDDIRVVVSDFVAGWCMSWLGMVFEDDLLRACIIAGVDVTMYICIGSSNIFFPFACVGCDGFRA